MISNLKTPGVYIEEKNAFPNSIVQVPTDLPVFIGYTEKALWNEVSVKNKLILISSMNEYQSIFGGYAEVSPILNEYQSSPATKESMNDFTLNGKDYSIELNGLFHLYNSLQLFFANGGSRCYILSIGTYESEGSNGPNIQHFETMSEQGVGGVFDFLKTQVEPTMILIPDALLFSESDDYYNLMNSSLSHCGEVKSRISLMDVFHGNLIDDISVFKTKQIAGEDPVSMLRAKINSQYLSYGAAYFPFVNSDIVSINQINLSALIKEFTQKFKDEDKVTAKKIDKTLSILENELANALLESTPVLMEAAKEKAYAKAHTTILAISSNYKILVQSVLKKINCLPIFQPTKSQQLL
ncbi:MAG TPA: hypothetical protein PLU17_13735, partial [Chitinophagaceae bacterium]|nr:hypothetical protein [Chitinophagaceae bacterium]